MNIPYVRLDSLRFTIAVHQHGNNVKTPLVLQPSQSFINTLLYRQRLNIIVSTEAEAKNHEFMRKWDQSESGV